MNGGSPKISFIPKNPLAEEGMFIARQRPRSVLGFLATILFLASVGAYTGLYFYHDFLSRNIQEKTAEIEMAKQELNNSPEISKAKVFNARADLARALLNNHIVVSPLFDFLAQNTLKNIFYKDFSFKDEGGALTLSLRGESPSYASLAYQSDVLRTSKNLLGFSVGNIQLTKEGSVTFLFNMVFDRAFLAYEKIIKIEESVFTEIPVLSNTIMATTTPTISPANTFNKEGKVVIPSPSSL